MSNEIVRETFSFLMTDFIQFLIKTNTKSRTTSEVKFPLWKKEPPSFKKVKYLLLPDWKTLSFLNWTLSMSEESILPKTFPKRNLSVANGTVICP